MFLFTTQLVLNPKRCIELSGAYLDMRTSDVCLSQVSLLALYKCFIEEHDYMHYPFSKLICNVYFCLLSFRNSDRTLLF